MTSTALTERIAEKIDIGVMRDLALTDPASGAVAPAFQSMGQVMEFAKVMAISKVGIRKHFRDNIGACIAIAMQAQRWQMDPFMVANKSYEVNDQIAYESQLIAAVINTRAPIDGRLRVRFTGEGQNRQCIAYATFKGETEPTEVISPPISQILPKNSPLWKTDPDQQLSYYTKRAWARRECPELLLGIYDIEEAQGMIDTGSSSTATNGPDAPPAPTREDFAAKPTDAVIEGTAERTQPEPQTGAAAATPKATRKHTAAPKDPPASEDPQPEPEPVQTEVVDRAADAELQGIEDAKAGLARDPEAHGLQPGPEALAYLAGYDAIKDAQDKPEPDEAKKIDPQAVLMRLAEACDAARSVGDITVIEREFSAQIEALDPDNNARALGMIERARKKWK